MALYEYRCRDCQHGFERIQKMGARAPRCPECGGRTERQISAPAIHFKGSGWYVTDYARKGKGSGSSESSGGGKTDGGGKSDGGSEKAADKPAKDKPAKKGDSGGSKKS